MKLDKRLVDEVIRLTRKYFKSEDKGYIRELIEARKVLSESAPWQVVDLVYDLAHYTRVSRKGTYNDIYKALAVFDIIVEDKEKENKEIRKENKDDL